jgi:hypothetical protein
MAHDVTMTEAHAIAPRFISGADVEILDGIAYVAGWVRLPGVDGKPECRIVARFAMPASEARTLGAKLKSDEAR